jgi:transcriptional regulator with XRE-family HTH domain
MEPLMITGSQIRAIRGDVGMEPAQFAQLLGIHSSTLYRWENAGEQPVRVEPLQLQLLTVLQQQIAKRSTAEDRAELSNSILTGLLIGGGLLGLFYLLDSAFAEKRPVRIPKTSPGGTHPADGEPKQPRRRTQRY